MGPDARRPPPTPQAQLAASQLQAELEKLRCTSALGSSEVEEAAQLKVLGHRHSTLPVIPGDPLGIVHPSLGVGEVEEYS